MFGAYQQYYGWLNDQHSPPVPPPEPPVVHAAPAPQHASAPSGGGGGGVTWVSMPKTPEKKLFSELDMVPLRLLLTKLADAPAPPRATGDLDDLVQRTEKKHFEEDTREALQNEYDTRRQLDRHAQAFARAAENQLFQAELDQARARTESERRATELRIQDLEARLGEALELVRVAEQALVRQLPPAPLGAAPSESSGWPWYAYAAIALGVVAVVYVAWPKPAPPPEPVQAPPVGERQPRKRRGKLRKR